MNTKIFISIFLIGLFASCKTTNKETTTSDFFGEAFEVKDVLTFEEMTAKLDNAEEAEVVVQGNVTGVCQAKGCWMNVSSETNPDAGEVFVKFHDYGFFMPKDLAGGKVVMKGKVYKEETTVEELRHYAEDEGKSAEEIAAIVDPISEMKFMATGVKILK